jgi:hypothetical protein
LDYGIIQPRVIEMYERIATETRARSAA